MAPLPCLMAVRMHNDGASCCILDVGLHYISRCAKKRDYYLFQDIASNSLNLCALNNVQAVMTQSYKK